MTGGEALHRSKDEAITLLAVAAESNYKSWDIVIITSPDATQITSLRVS